MRPRRDAPGRMVGLDMPVSVEATPRAAVVRMSFGDPTDVPLVRAFEALISAGYVPVGWSARHDLDGTSQRAWIMLVHHSGGVPVDPEAEGLTFHYDDLTP